MDDLIVSNATSIVKLFQNNEDCAKELKTMIRVLQGSVKPSKSEV